MSIGAKDLGKCTWTANTPSENPLVPATQRWKCSSKVANDSCLFITQLWLESEPQFFSIQPKLFSENKSEKRGTSVETLIVVVSKIRVISPLYF